MLSVQRCEDSRKRENPSPLVHVKEVQHKLCPIAQRIEFFGGRYDEVNGENTILLQDESSQTKTVPGTTRYTFQKVGTAHPARRIQRTKSCLTLFSCR